MNFDNTLDCLDNAKNYVCATAYKHRKPLIATVAGLGVFVAGGLTGPWLYGAMSDDDIVFEDKSYTIVDLDLAENTLLRITENGPLCGYDVEIDKVREVVAFTNDGSIDFGDLCIITKQ
jgi:hypothetical protein